MTCPRTKVGGSSGSTTINELSDGSFYVKRNGWSIETFFNLITLNKPFTIKIDMYYYAQSRYRIRINGITNLLFVPNSNTTFSFEEDGGSNIGSIPVNQWYTVELEYTGRELIGLLYDENRIYASISKETIISDSFDVGIVFGYYGTYDNRGYENKIKNIRIY